MCFPVASLTDSEIKGDVLYLGYYQSAFNWDDETAKVTGVWGQNGYRPSCGLRAQATGESQELAGVNLGVRCLSRQSPLGSGLL